MGVCIQSISGDGPVINKMKQYDLAHGFVWIVGRRDPNADSIAEWHIQGVATAEEIALQMCVDETYFIGPIPIDTALSHDKIEWAGSYFPIVKK